MGLFSKMGLSMDYDGVWVTVYPISLPAVDPISGKGLPQPLGLILNFHATVYAHMFSVPLCTYGTSMVTFSNCT